MAGHGHIVTTLLLLLLLLLLLGWLEPLLDPIARNPNISTIPVIEIIDDNTFQLKTTTIDAIQVGGFDWDLLFKWILVPTRELQRQWDKTDPIRSPTMPGKL